MFIRYLLLIVFVFQTCCECRRSSAFHVESHVQFHAPVEEDSLSGRCRRRRNLFGRSERRCTRSGIGSSLHNAVVLPPEAAHLRDELRIQVTHTHNQIRFSLGSAGSRNKVAETSSTCIGKDLTDQFKTLSFFFFKFYYETNDIIHTVVGLLIFTAFFFSLVIRLILTE